jgi:phage-related protein
VKPVVWLGDSLLRLREFPAEAMHDTGYQLELVQESGEPKDWKPMPSIGAGVSELRVQAGGAFRLIYLAKFSEAIYVLHAFHKKTRKTAKADIDLARRRLRTLLAQRGRA